MKKLVLAALAALCLAGTAHAQNFLGVYDYPGANVPATFSSSQNIYALNDTISVGMADSTQVFDFSLYDGIGLQFVNDSLATTSTNPVRVAVEIRSHVLPNPGQHSYAGADSAYTKATWFPSEEYSLMSTAQGDSVAYGDFRTGTTTVQHDGEIVFILRKEGASAGGWSFPTGVYQWFPFRAIRASVKVRVLAGTANTSRVKLIVVGLRRN